MPDLEVEGSEFAAKLVPAVALRRWVSVLALGLGLLALGLVALWLQRESLAHRIIAGQLARYDLPATYQLERIGPRTQVLSRVVVGDPARPNFTAERIEVRIAPTLGLPMIGSVRLVRPRLYGALQGGRLTFGTLDRVLFAPGAPRTAGLPDLDLRLEDGRARIDTDYGPVGIKAEGRGNIRRNFAGRIAAIAPALQLGNCRLNGASAYGALRSVEGAPQFSGPVRLGQAACPELTATGLAAQTELRADKSLTSLTGTAAIAGGPLDWSAQRALRLTGALDLSLRPGGQTVKADLALVDVSGALAADRFGLQLTGQSRGGLGRFEGEGLLTGAGVRPGAMLERQLAVAEQAVRGTLGRPLLAQVRAGLRREGADSQLTAAFTLRRSGALTTLLVPRLELVGSSGQAVLVISRGQVASGGPGGMRVTGNLRTGGAGLPQLSGQIERRGGGVIEARLTMPDYATGSARAALPQLLVVRRPDGSTGLAGQVEISGALPGGRVNRLVVPLDGTWSADGRLALWRRCTALQFASLRYASLTLGGQALTLCPGPMGAILTSDTAGIRFAAGVPALALSGQLGGSALRLRSGAVGFAWPGSLVARQIEVGLGPGGATNRLFIAALTGRLGGASGGRFSGAEAGLAAVPLDLREMSGAWRFANGRLSIAEGAFRLEDRLTDDRFRPLLARDARLTLENSRIAALAALREPASDRIVTTAAISHDLASGRGHADLAVENLVFDERLQPDTLTYLALGVIANARGAVRGTGRIDWRPDKVSSAGRFSTDKLDFAAVFGPVKGLSGTVEFSDLLGMVTAPDQTVKIAAINPGIEVSEGVLRFQLEPERVLVVKGAEWPFSGGRLQLLPTRMRLGAADERRFTLRLTAADAAKFVQQIELSNITATGVFDGDLPLVFDEQGGRIEGGMLRSRPNGGNVSYVGALTYKDLGAMANFAFQSLRSLDFRQMQIGMDGELDGEIVTRVRIDGVTQGVGARRNFVTRELGKLPIRFNINVRAPFQRLLHSFRSLYDPTYVRDPRELGLIDATGKPREQQPDIQPPVSRKVP